LPAVPIVEFAPSAFELLFVVEQWNEFACLCLVRWNVPNWGHGLGDARRVDLAVGMGPLHPPPLPTVALERRVRRPIQLRVADLFERATDPDESVESVFDGCF